MGLTIIVTNYFDMSLVSKKSSMSFPFEMEINCAQFIQIVMQGLCDVPLRKLECQQY